MQLSKGKTFAQSTEQASVDERRARYLLDGAGTANDKIYSFSRFIGRQNTAKFLAYADLFRKTEGVLGSIAECGVYYGQGLMTYANLCASLEPYNYPCRVVGFDTFSGDLGVSDLDRKGAKFTRDDGDYLADCYDDLTTAAELFDEDRPISHITKIELIKGDLRKTAAQYIEDNPDTVWRIIHLSVNIEEPTRSALEAFWPRLSKGGIVAVHGVNYNSAGAQRAVRDVCADPCWKTFPQYPNLTWFVKE